jgi:NADPH-dependent 2,4-dienoyl-CoA reductase/sulfur reductase-like enzyme
LAGINISGGYSTFPGVLGTAVTRVCRLEIGRSGLTVREAETAGFSVEFSKVDTTTTASYMSESAPMTVKLVGERGSGRVLGIQIVGGQGAAKRVDVVAASLAGRLTVEDLVGLDLGYAPPFSSVWDPVQVAARALIRKL